MLGSRGTLSGRGCPPWSSEELLRRRGRVLILQPGLPPRGSDHLSSPQRNSSLPDENNVARLQEELKALKVREGEAVASARELKLQLQELSDTWQVRALARMHTEAALATLEAKTDRLPLPPGPPVPRGPLEGVPPEVGPGRAAGRADECPSARGPGSGRGSRAAAARGGTRDAGGPERPRPLWGEVGWGCRRPGRWLARDPCPPSPATLAPRTTSTATY